MSMSNEQLVVYYVKQAPAVDEDSPYQGKIIKAVGVHQGYIPTERDVIEFAHPESDQAVLIQLCLN